MSRRSVKPLRLSLGLESDDGEAPGKSADERELRQDSRVSRGKRHAEPIEAAGGSSSPSKAVGVKEQGPLETYEVNLRQLRKTVRASLEQNLSENAVFFASKLVTLSGGQLKDIHLLAQSYFVGKQFRRAVHLIQQQGLLQLNLGQQQQENVRRNRFEFDEKAVKRAQPQSTRNTRSASSRKTPRDSIVDETIAFTVLGVQCLIESAQFDEAQNVVESVLGDLNIDRLGRRARRVAEPYAKFIASVSGKDLDAREIVSERAHVNPVAVLCHLRGRIYETLDNRPRAADWYKAALFCDIHCYEAFESLIDNQLKPSEERQLLEDLNRLGAFDGDTAWLLPVYTSRLSKHDYSEPVDSRFSALKRVTAEPEEDNFVDPNVQNLGKDFDCAADRAESLYQQHDAQGAYQITKQVRSKDPYHLRCITVYLASLVELKRKSELFHTAHQLVDAYPSQAVSWFAVACYYFCILKYDSARRFFHKATTMDPSMAEAWIGFGHSFAMQDESDQAMAAYRTASRLFTGCHLPILCTAIEYLRTNNVTLAESFCRKAKSMCATDPLVFNELGVVYYRQGKYKQAADCFQEGLRLCENQPERLRFAWEPAMYNLAHSHRKLGQYDEAIRLYESALSYSPKEASTFAALGLTYHLQGRLEEAIQNYHNALGLKPEDTFASDMLDKALMESYANPNHVPAIDGDPAPLPPPKEPVTEGLKMGLSSSSGSLSKMEF